MMLREYPQWSETGIDWLQQIPEHWEIKKFRFMFNLGRGLGITKSNLIHEGIPCVNYGEIHSKLGFEVNPEKHDLKFVPKEYLISNPNALLEHGDFVYADTSEDIEGSGNFTHLNSIIPTFAGYHTITAKPVTNNSSRFLAYLFDSELFRFQIRKSVSGVKVFSVTQDILKSCYIWLPPTNEQIQITKFLDHKTAQIDRLIEKKKALIEKLNEQRIALITNAVTKGLNPNAPMKDSEMDWLSEVPKRWEVTKFKYQVGFQEGPGIMAVDFKDSGIPLARIRNVQGEFVNLEGCNFLDPEKVEKRWPHFRCQLGDLIISGSASTGLISEISEDSVGAIVYTGLIRLWAIGDIEKEFVRWFVSSNTFFSQIDRLKTGSTIQHFGPEHLNQMFIPLPPRDEQIEICNFLERSIKKLNSMLEVNNRTIEKLNEYRKALIASAVTGKIDVRGVYISEGY